MFCLFACAEMEQQEVSANEGAQANQLDVIDSLMKVQEDAWNRGDLETFMAAAYWQDDSLAFIGRSGVNHGWLTTLNNYKLSYPDELAMGLLTFGNEHMELLSDSSAYVIGSWRLDRSADTLSGYYTLLWKRIEGRWVIVADHSS